MGITKQEISALLFLLRGKGWAKDYNTTPDGRASLGYLYNTLGNVPAKKKVDVVREIYLASGLLEDQEILQKCKDLLGITDSIEKKWKRIQVYLNSRHANESAYDTLKELQRELAEKIGEYNKLDFKKREIELYRFFESARDRLDGKDSDVYNHLLNLDAEDEDDKGKLYALHLAGYIPWDDAFYRSRRVDQGNKLGQGSFKVAMEATYKNTLPDPDFEFLRENNINFEDKTIEFRHQQKKKESQREYVETMARNSDSGYDELRELINEYAKEEQLSEALERKQSLKFSQTDLENQIANALHNKDLNTLRLLQSSDRETKKFLFGQDAMIDEAIFKLHEENMTTAKQNKLIEIDDDDIASARFKVINPSHQMGRSSRRFACGFFATCACVAAGVVSGGFAWAALGAIAAKYSAATAVAASVGNVGGVVASGVAVSALSGLAASKLAEYSPNKKKSMLQNIVKIAGISNRSIRKTRRSLFQTAYSLKLCIKQVNKKRKKLGLKELHCENYSEYGPSKIDGNWVADSQLSLLANAAQEVAFVQEQQKRRVLFYKGIFKKTKQGRKSNHEYIKHCESWEFIKKYCSIDKGMRVAFNELLDHNKLIKIDSKEIEKISEIDKYTSLWRSLLDKKMKEPALETYGTDAVSSDELERMQLTLKSATFLPKKLHSSELNHIYKYFEDALSSEQKKAAGISASDDSEAGGPTKRKKLDYIQKAFSLLEKQYRIDAVRGTKRQELVSQTGKNKLKRLDEKFAKDLGNLSENAERRRVLNNFPWATLQEYHNQGIAHNDIKPDNLFLALDGNVGILDFGLLIEDVSDSDVIIGGTPAYRSPESCGEKKDKFSMEDIQKNDCYAMLLSVAAIHFGSKPGDKISSENNKILAGLQDDFTGLVSKRKIIPFSLEIEKDKSPMSLWLNRMIVPTTKDDEQDNFNEDAGYQTMSAIEIGEQHKRVNKLQVLYDKIRNLYPEYEIELEQTVPIKDIVSKMEEQLKTKMQEAQMEDASILGDAYSKKSLQEINLIAQNLDRAWMKDKGLNHESPDWQLYEKVVSIEPDFNLVNLEQLGGEIIRIIREFMSTIEREEYSKYCRDIERKLLAGLEPSAIIEELQSYYDENRNSETMKHFPSFKNELTKFIEEKKKDFPLETLIKLSVKEQFPGTPLAMLIDTLVSEDSDKIQNLQERYRAVSARAQGDFSLKEKAEGTEGTEMENIEKQIVGQEMELGMGSVSKLSTAQEMQFIAVLNGLRAKVEYQGKQAKIKPDIQRATFIIIQLIEKKLPKSKSMEDCLEELVKQCELVNGLESEFTNKFQSLDYGEDKKNFFHDAEEYFTNIDKNTIKAHMITQELGFMPADENYQKYIEYIKEAIEDPKNKDCALYQKILSGQHRQTSLMPFLDSQISPQKALKAKIIENVEGKGLTRT